jgi:putative ATP-dependent endonuclease of OLD family
MILVYNKLKIWKDYLDVTKAEILFARGVILVEGTAESFIVPTVANNMGKNLDEYGITVCSINGTDFIPFIKILSKTNLNIPFIVLTDGDSEEVDGEKIIKME